MRRKYSIGRLETNDIVINNETVSRKHAELTIEENRIVISDFGSKNGTFVIRDNKPIRINMAEVATNDTVVFGDFSVKVEDLLRMASVKSDINRNVTSMPPKSSSNVMISYPSYDSEKLEYAGFWVRLGAYLVDAILIIIVTSPILISIYGFDYFDYKGSKYFIDFGDFIISWLFPTTATVLFWFYRQATPGKMTLSLRIVDAKTGGHPSLGQCIGRCLAYSVSFFPLCLGFIWIAFDKKKQGWHDKLAGTLVLKYPKPKNKVTFD